MLSRHQFFPVDLYMQYNPDQNSRKFFCGYWKTDFKVYKKFWKTQNSQLNFEGQESI